MRKLIKFTKTEHCITITVHDQKRFNQDKRKIEKNKWSTKPFSGSQMFYVLKSEIDRLIVSKNAIISNDIYSFLKLSITPTPTKALLNLTFSWLGGSNHTLSGFIEYIEIDFEKFFQYYEGINETLSIINDQNNSIVKQEFNNSRNNLKNILNNKIVKRKFIKFISSRSMTADRYTHIRYNDDSMNEFSFGFAVYNKDEFVYNGGLIFHKDFKDKDDLSKGKFQIHT